MDKISKDKKGSMILIKYPHLLVCLRLGLQLVLLFQEVLEASADWA